MSDGAAAVILDGEGRIIWLDLTGAQRLRELAGAVRERRLAGRRGAM